MLYVYMCVKYVCGVYVYDVYMCCMCMCVVCVYTCVCSVYVYGGVSIFTCGGRCVRVSADALRGHGHQIPPLPAQLELQAIVNCSL